MDGVLMKKLAQILGEKKNVCTSKCSEDKSLNTTLLTVLLSSLPAKQSDQNIS